MHGNAKKLLTTLAQRREIAMYTTVIWLKPLIIRHASQSASQGFAGLSILFFLNTGETL